MKDVQLDRRSRRTKRMLKNAFIELMQQKPCYKITVTDIVEQADFNRSTFYLHYKYKEQLIDDFVTEMIEGLVKAFRYPYQDSKHLNLYLLSPSDVVLFDYIKNNATFFSLWKTSDSILGFQEKFVHTMIALFKEDINLLPKGNDDINNNLLITFRAYGILGLIQEWIKSDFSTSPRYMADQLIKILNYQPLKFYDVKPSKIDSFEFNFSTSSASQNNFLT
ncbi:TetR/AcrR family transcriptional regulator [Virgibacillus byunsanensis]|uniref:TetR/AcrR family transcriptional regulator n=1 Tax=Virgibacillus byunsanensis TaxID=570945 RepID=A0ABW3LLX1_9BACI